MFGPEHAPRILDEDQLDRVHETAMRILEEIGLDILHERARALLAGAGLGVEDARVRFDRGFVLEQVAKAPSTFPLRARNPERSLEVGAGTPGLVELGGPPLARELGAGRGS